MSLQFDRNIVESVLTDSEFEDLLINQALGITLSLQNQNLVVAAIDIDDICNPCKTRGQCIGESIRDKGWTCGKSRTGRRLQILIFGAVGSIDDIKRSTQETLIDTSQDRASEGLGFIQCQKSIEPESRAFGKDSKSDSVRTCRV